MKARVTACMALLASALPSSAAAVEGDRRPALYCRLASAPEAQAAEGNADLEHGTLGIAFEPQNQTLQDLTKIEIYDPTSIVKGYQLIEFSLHSQEHQIRAIWSSETGDLKFLELHESHEPRVFDAVIRHQDFSNASDFEQSMVGACEIFRSTEDTVAIDFIRSRDAEVNQ